MIAVISITFYKISWATLHINIHFISRSELLGFLRVCRELNLKYLNADDVRAGSAVIREPASHRHIRFYCRYNTPPSVTATEISEPSKPRHVNASGSSEYSEKAGQENSKLDWIADDSHWRCLTLWLFWLKFILISRKNWL